MGFLDKMRGRVSEKRSTTEPKFGVMPDAESFGDDLIDDAGEGGWTVSLTETSDGCSDTVISTTETRKTVSNEMALSLAAAYACIDRISTSIAMVPFKIVKIVDGETEEIKEHPAKKVLEVSPNDWQTPFTMRRQLMVDVLGGNGYIRIIRNNVSGEIHELEYCKESSVDLQNTTGSRWVYTYTDEYGKYHTIFPEDMIHVRALGNINRKGLSPIKLHASSIRMGLDMQSYGESFFNGGAKPSGIIGVKGGLEAKSWDKLIANWNKTTRSAAVGNKKNNVMFLPADITYNPISISPIDAALIQSMKLTRSEIGGIYNVPGYMIGDMDKAYSGNVTTMMIGFVKNTLQPWVTNIEQEVSKKVLSDEDIAQGITVKMDMDELMRGTPEEIMKMSNEGVKGGLMTRNEGRIRIGYKRITNDPTMDVCLVNVSQSNFADSNAASGKDAGKKVEDKANPEKEEDDNEANV